MIEAVEGVEYFHVHLRNGKDVLACGVEQRDRFLNRKTPRAIGFTPAKIHTCSECGRSGPWVDSTWTWFGSWEKLEDGKPVLKFCTAECRHKHGDRLDREQRRGAGHRSQHEPAESKQAFYDRMHDRHERERSMTAHRKFPGRPPWPKDRRGNGWCTWCGEAVQKPRKTWHPDCLHEYKLHVDTDVQWHHLVKRDLLRCAICDLRGKWIDGGIIFMRKYDETSLSALAPSIVLEVDHVVPLFRIERYAPAERWKLYGPDNLWLLCPDCHKAKNACEAAERAAARS